MAVAITLQDYLETRGVAYELVPHQRTGSSAETARAAGIPGEYIAKAVVLRTADGFLLAVLPASHHLQLGALRRWLQEPVGLATEAEVEARFPDCDSGAVPPLGAAYGLDVLVDDSLAAPPDVWFEAGDHATLVHVSGRDFAALMQTARHGSFAGHA